MISRKQIMIPHKLEELLFEWIKKQRAKQLPVRRGDIKEQVGILTKQLGIFINFYILTFFPRITKKKIMII